MLLDPFIIAIIGATIVVSHVDLVEELTTGYWWLTASGTNIERIEKPETNYGCVKMYISDFGKYKCIFNNYEHHFHDSRVVKVHGRDEKNKTEVYSIGPIHEWNENMELSIATVMKTPMCWSSKFKLRNYTFTVLQIDNTTTDQLFLLGTYARLLRTGSENHSALLTRDKIFKNDSTRIIAMIEDYVAEKRFIGKCPRMKIMCHTCD